MNKRFCSSCGVMLAGEAKFCSGCGQPQTSTIESETQNSIQNGPEINQPVHPVPKKTKINKWVYIAIAAVIAIFAYTSFTKSTPEKVAEEFAGFMFTYEAKKAKELLAFSADEDLVDDVEWMIENKRDDPEYVKDELKVMAEEGYILKEFIIFDKSETKNYATLSINMIVQNGEQEAVYFELVKESGKWKVVSAD